MLSNLSHVFQTQQLVRSVQEKEKKKMIVRVIMAETDQRHLYVSTSSFCKKKAKGEECVFDLLKAV